MVCYRNTCTICMFRSRCNHRVAWNKDEQQRKIKNRKLTIILNFRFHVNRVPRIIIIKRKWVFKWRNDWKTATFQFIFTWFHLFTVPLTLFNLLCVFARRSFIYSKWQFHIHITKRNIENCTAKIDRPTKLKNVEFSFTRCEMSPAGTGTHITDIAAPFFFHSRNLFTNHRCE